MKLLIVYKHSVEGCRGLSDEFNLEIETQFINIKNIKEILKKHQKEHGYLFVSSITITNIINLDNLGG
jgi:hypothetical protein